MCEDEMVLNFCTARPIASAAWSFCNGPLGRFTYVSHPEGYRRAESRRILRVRSLTLFFCRAHHPLSTTLEVTSSDPKRGRGTGLGARVDPDRGNKRLHKPKSGLPIFWAGAVGHVQARAAPVRRKRARVSRPPGLHEHTFRRPRRGPPGTPRPVVAGVSGWVGRPRRHDGGA